MTETQTTTGRDTDGRAAPPEISWFSALCDDDYELLGIPDPALQIEHGPTAASIVEYRRPARLRQRAVALRLRRSESTPSPSPPPSATVDRADPPAPGRPDGGDVAAPAGPPAGDDRPALPTAGSTVNIISSDLPGQQARLRASLPANARVHAGRFGLLLDRREPSSYHGEFVAAVDRPAPGIRNRRGADARRSTSAGSRRRRRRRRRPPPTCSSPGRTRSPRSAETDRRHGGSGPSATVATSATGCGPT